MSPLVVLGAVVVTIRAGRCGGCGSARMVFVNVNGKTQCAGCAAKLSNNQLEQAHD